MAPHDVVPFTAWYGPVRTALSEQHERDIKKKKKQT